MKRKIIAILLIFVITVQLFPVISMASEIPIRDYPTTAYDSLNDKYLVAYQYQEDSDLKTTIRHFIINSDGSRGNELKTSGETTVRRTHPKVAFSEKSGTYLVTWSEPGAGLVGQVVNSDGSLLGNNFIIASSGGDHQIAYDNENDRFMVIWEVSVSSFDYGNIFGQLINSDGTLFGNKITIMESYGSQIGSTIEYDSVNKKFLVTWLDDRAQRNYYDIFGKFLNADGSNHGMDFIISSRVDYLDQRDLDLAYDNDADQFLITWSARTTKYGDYKIFGRLLKLGKDYTNDDRFLIAEASYNLHNPSVVFDQVLNQYLVIMGHDVVVESYNNDIYGQFVNPDGGVVGSKFPILKSPFNEYSAKVLTTSTPGKYLLSYDHGSSVATQSHIIGSIFVDGPDTELPVWPQGSQLTASNKGKTSLTLNWSQAEDNVKLNQYTIYKNGTLLTHLAGEITSYDVINLDENTQYTFSLEAYDAAGNLASEKLSLNVTTLQDDTITPTWPDGSALDYSNLTDNSVTVTWPNALDNVGVTDYKIYVNEELAANVTGNINSYNLTTLQPNTEYSIKVEAGDATGNWTTNGPTLTVSTLEQTIAPKIGYRPKFAFDSKNNRYLVVYKDNVSHELYHAIVNADGSWGTPMKTTTDIVDIEELKVIYNQASSNFLLVYSQTNEIVGQFINNDGVVLDRITIADSSDAIEKAYPDVSYNNQNNNILVVWEHSTNPLANNYDIKGQLLDSTGGLIGSNFVINDETYEQLYPAVSYDETNNKYLVVWSDHRNGELTPRIYVQWINATDASLYGISYAITDSSFDQKKPAIAYDNLSDRFLIIWHDEDTKNNIVEIRGKLLNLIYESDELAIADYALHNDGSVTFDSFRNQFLVAWSDDKEKVDDFNLYGQYIATESGLVGESFPIVQTINTEQYPQLAFNSTSKNIVVLYNLGATLGSEPNTIELETLIAEDIKPPYWEGDLSSSNITQNSVTLAWPSANDNVEVISYKIFNGDTLLATVDGNVHSYNVTGLQPETQYTFKVEAGDASANWSGPLTLVVTTASLPVVNPTPPGPINTESDDEITEPVLSVIGQFLTEEDSIDISNYITGTLENGNQEVGNFVISDSLFNSTIKDKPKGSKLTLAIPDSVDKVNLKLSNTLVQNLQEKESILEISFMNHTFVIPVLAIDTELFNGIAGESGASQTVLIEINRSEQDQKRMLEQATKQGLDLISDPFEFRMVYSYDNKVIDIGNYRNYIMEIIDLPNDVNPNSIAGVFLNSDQILSPFPTKVQLPSATDNGKVVLRYQNNGLHGLVTNTLLFKDIAGHWAEEEINKLASKLIVNGYDGDNFKPNENVTRAEIVAIIVRALGLNETDSNKLFSDVSGDEWYAKSINAAVEAGIINGYDDGTFKPNVYVTREEVAVMVVRALKYVESNVEITDNEINNILASYVDSEEISSWSSEGIALASKYEIINGYSDGSFMPKNNSTRAEAVVMILRMLEKVNFL